MTRRRARLSRSFFERAPEVVATSLLGAIIEVRDDEGVRRVQIVETEAYGGLTDPASHAYRGRTPRNAVMFGPAGYLYVYRSYGMHWCANVVTGDAGVPHAVLLRAGAWLDTVDHGRVPRGPGNLTKALGLTGHDDGVDCCARPPGRVSFWSGPETGLLVASSPRVGVTLEHERPWRFYFEGHGGVSRYVASPRRK